MSVLGIDLGNRYATLAVAQRGGIDILVNDVSNRKTPSMVGFIGNQRFIGESGLVQFARNVQNTITQIKRLIGRKWSDAEFQEEKAYLPYKFTEGTDGNVALQVNYNDEQTTFTPEEILAMYLSKLKEIVERSQGVKVKDVVLSVPVFFTSSQRKALLDAAHISELNVLRLINETTASALAWGIYKEFDEKEATYVMFFDMGDSATSVSVVAYTKGKMKVLSHAWDRALGGRSFDRMLLHHFIEEFKGKYKIDVNTNARAKARLEAACEKCKIVLSANSQAPLNVESLMEDKDVSGMVTREEFEKMSRPLLERFALPIKKALADAGIESSKLSAIELIGGGSRMPQVATVVKEILGKEHSRTLNAEEAVAKGCALQCAILSPLLKVRDFKVEDCTAFPINLEWEDVTPSAMNTDEPTEIFAKHSTIPASKVITFPRNNPVQIKASYGPSAELPAGVPPQIGTYTIPTVPQTKTGEPGKIRVKVRVDLHGVFAVESAEMTEIVPPEPEQAPPAEAMDTADKKETPAGEAKKEEEKKPEKKEPTTIKHVLAVQSETAGLSGHQLQQAVEAERRRIAQDIEVRETAERKNAVESYVYDTRNALSEELAPYIEEAAKEEFLRLLNATEDWLYGDGESAKRDAYIAKLAELRKLGDPVFKRKREDEDRPHAVASLKAAIEYYAGLADSTDPKYEHISQEDREKVKKKLQEAADFVLPKVQQHDTLPKTADPVILAIDINQWRENLDKYCPPIMNKPKPAPPKEEKKEEKKEETPQPAATEEKKVQS